MKLGREAELGLGLGQVALLESALHLTAHEEHPPPRRRRRLARVLRAHAFRIPAWTDTHDATRRRGRGRSPPAPRRRRREVVWHELDGNEQREKWHIPDLTERHAALARGLAGPLPALGVQREEADRVGQQQPVVRTGGDTV